MKNLFKWLALAGLLTLLFSLRAMADGYAVAVDPSVVPPDWLLSLLMTLKPLPYIGPTIIFIAKWSSIIAIITTALAGFLIALSKGLSFVSELAPALAWMGKVADFLNKLIPYLKWASMLNEPKPWAPQVAAKTEPPKS